MTPLDVLTIFPASIPWVLNATNAVAWPRATRAAETTDRLSVLVPARDEAATIVACVEAALAAQPPAHEVVVCDDGSTDATPQLLADLAAQHDRLTVIQAPPLPDGWVGKPHACHTLAQHATGDVLLFVDADTRLGPQATGQVQALLDDHRADVLTAFPGQELGTWLEQLVVPMLPLTFTSWFPLDLVWKHTNPALLVVNGQVLALRREAYDAIGGFAAIRDAVVDDMAICRRAKEDLRRVVFADGTGLATARMYRSAGEVWAGFSKNFFPGLGWSWLGLAFVVATYLTCFVLPYVRFGADVAMGALPWAAAIGVGCNVAARTILAVRLRHPAWSVVAHPVGVLVWLAIGLNSAWWSVTGRVRWRGRTYARPGAVTRP